MRPHWAAVMIAARIDSGARIDSADRTMTTTLNRLELLHRSGQLDVDSAGSLCVWNANAILVAINEVEHGRFSPGDWYDYPAHRAQAVAVLREALRRSLA